MGINVWEVIEAAKTKPYGFQAFYPGPGVGGHCIPLDPYYLTWKAKEYNYHTKIIDAAGGVNDFMPQFVAMRVARILNRFKKSINGSKILILGVAYKQDIDDYRESPSLKVINYLKNDGAEVRFHDPYVSQYKYLGETVKGVILSSENLNGSDIVVLNTMHSCFDYMYIQRNAKFIFDTKNAFRDVTCRDNIEVL
jgi:UDP-N-acetyl-D-glucosamine dehydrogenase